MAIACLERVLMNLEIPDEQQQSILDIFWQFVETDDLAKWDQDCRDHQLVMDICDYSGGWSSTKPNYPGFDQLEDWFYQLIFEMFELGGAELYGAIRGYSELSYENLVNILTIVNQNGHDIPSLDPYLRSPFSQINKWGEAGRGTSVSREFFYKEEI